MKLIKTEDVSGYYIEDIEKELGERYKEFVEWFYGQTGTIFKGRLVVYKWDYDRFLRGAPAMTI